MPDAILASGLESLCLVGILNGNWYSMKGSPKRATSCNGSVCLLGTINGIRIERNESMKSAIVRIYLSGKSLNYGF